MEETKDVSKVDDKEMVTGEIRKGDFSDPLEEHEYMFIEKEEPELDETEDLGSLVNEVLLQSAALIEGVSGISDEQEILGETPLLNPVQNVFPSPMNENTLSLPSEGNTVSASDVMSTSVTSTVATESMKTQVKTPPVQTQPKVSQTSTSTSQTNNIRNGQLSCPDFIQNTINVQNMQANILRNIGLSLIEASNRGILQTVSSSQPVNNIKNINFLRMGVRPGTSMRPLQAIPRSVQMAQVRAQMARFGIPSHNLRMLSSNFFSQNVHQSARIPHMANALPMSRVPHFVNVPPARSVPNLARVPPAMSGPRLAHIPPVSNVPQTAMQTAQLNLMKNLGIPLQRPGLPTPKQNVSQLNAFQNASDLVRAFQMQSKHSSKARMECFVPVSSASQNANQASSIGNTQTQVQSSGLSRSLGSSQFSVPRLMPPQLVANALQTKRVPLIHLMRQVSNQPPLPPMNVGLQQNVTPNIQRLSVPSVVNNGPRVGITPLSNNVQRLNVPQVAASVPRIHATQISGTGGVLRANTSVVSSSVNRTLIPPMLGNMNHILTPQNMASLTHVKGMSLHSPSTNISQIPVPQTSAKIPKQSQETIAARLAYYMALMKEQHFQSMPVPGTSSTSATTSVAHTTTSQTSSASVIKTPKRHWESASRNSDKCLLQGQQPKDLSKVSGQVVKSTPLEVTCVQPHQQTAGISSEESFGEPHCAKNSKLEVHSTGDPPKVSEPIATSLPLEEAGVQQHQQTAKTSSQQSSGELNEADNSKLERCSTEHPPKVSEQAAIRTPLDVTGVLQNQQTTGASQQSSGELHQAENSKLEASHSTIHQKTKQKAKSARMKRHLRNQIIFLKLWKKFEKYNYRFLNCANKKKSVEARKQRHLLFEKKKNKLAHKPSNE